MRRFVSYLLLFLLSCCALAEQKPEAIITALYKPYSSDSLDEQTGIKQVSALDAILPHASQTLAKLISNELACQKREQGICTIDSDIIINGQDWKLSNFSLDQKQIDANKVIIIAHFMNMDTANAVTYSMIKEGNQWHIDNVQADRLKPDGSVATSWNLKAMLK